MDRELLRSVGKRLRRPLYRHTRGTRPDLFIHSTQRSGSTLLFDMVASQDRMKAVGEPLQERKIRAVRRYLSTPASRYAWLDEGDLAGLDAYLSALLDGRFIEGFERSYDPRNPRHHYLTDRSVTKILRASQLYSWLRGRFAGEHLFLARHPIAVALSRARNGWAAPVEAFVAADAWYARRSADQRAIVDASREMALEFRHVVVWCLEHVGLSWDESFLAYEHLVTRPDRHASAIADRFQIEDRVAFAEALGRPSRSSRYSRAETRQAIELGDRSPLVTGWRTRAEDELVAFTARCLETFEIGWYRADEVMPVVRSDRRGERLPGSGS